MFPELPGCATAGDTEAEATANAKEALALWFEPAPVKLRKNARLVEKGSPHGKTLLSEISEQQRTKPFFGSRLPNFRVVTGAEPR